MYAYYVPGTVLGPRDMAVNKIKGKNLPSWILYTIRRLTINITANFIVL